MSKNKSMMVGGKGAKAPTEVSLALDEVFAAKARISPFSGVGEPRVQTPEGWTKTFGAVVNDVISKSH